MPFARSNKVHDPASLYDYAVQALGRRMRTVAELKRLLRQKNVEGDKDAAIEAVIRKLKEQRYLDDSRYASMYATIRKEGAKHGPQRIITDLKLKGVHKDVIAKTVDDTYDGVNEEELARAFIARKRLKQPTKSVGRDAASRKQSQRETAKVFRALLRAGFKSATIIKVLKKWDVEDELLTALDEESQ